LLEGGLWSFRLSTGGFLYFVRAAELACFHDFCRHLLTNPVRIICVFVSRMAFCEPGRVSRVSSAELLSEFQSFGPWYLSEFARKWPLKFSLEHGRSPCSSHCGRSKWRGLAVKACFSKQPRDSSNSGWVTLSLCQKHRAGEGCYLETLSVIRECGLLKWYFTV